MKRKWIWLGIIILLGGAAITMSVLSKGMQNTYEAEARSQFAARGVGQEKRFLFGLPGNTSTIVLQFDREKKVFSVYSINDAANLN